MNREPVPLDTRKAMTPARRRRILEQHDGMCAYPDCYVCTDLEIDHVIPLALGGKDSDENLEPLCRHHHRIKTQRDIKFIAKAKRNERKSDALKRKPPTMKSRGFNKTWKRRFNGTVERRT